MRSNLVSVVVGSPANKDEENIARLSMNTGVGRAFVFGDYGTDEVARKHLEELAGNHSSTVTGAAAALVLANTQSRDLRDLYSGQTLRKADTTAAMKRFKAVVDKAVKDDPSSLVRLATAVAAPTEADAPVLGLVADHLENLCLSIRRRVERETPSPQTPLRPAKENQYPPLLTLLRMCKGPGPRLIY